MERKGRELGPKEVINTAEKVVRCAACGRRLTNTDTKRVGYGPVCYQRIFGTTINGSVRKSKAASRPENGSRLRTWKTKKKDDGQVTLFDVLMYERMHREFPAI